MARLQPKIVPGWLPDFHGKSDEQAVRGSRGENARLLPVYQMQFSTLAHLERLYQPHHRVVHPGYVYETKIKVVSYAPVMAQRFRSVGRDIQLQSILIILPE